MLFFFFFKQKTANECRISDWSSDVCSSDLEKVRAVERIVNGLGFTCIRETINAVETWLSSLPGHVYANVRQPIVHTLNLAHLMPLSSVRAGPARNAHLDGPPLLTAETSGSTPFRLSTHVGDVGPIDRKSTRLNSSH